MDVRPSQPAEALQPAKSAQPAEPKGAGLASLPANVLYRICEETLGIYNVRGRDDRRHVDTLSQVCKALRATLADAEHILAAFHTVSILPTLDGLRFLAGIAAGPYAKHVRHVTIAGEFPASVSVFLPLHDATDALFGLGPDDHPRPDGMETPFARQLGDVLCTLPALRGAGVGSGFIPLPRKIDGQAFGFQEPWGNSNKWPFPRRTVTSAPAHPFDRERIFRSVLSALAQAAAAGRPVTTLKVEDMSSSFTADTLAPAFTFSASQLELVGPLLRQLRTLYIGAKPPFQTDRLAAHKYHKYDYGPLDSFLRRCSGLTELYLEGPLKYARIIPRLMTEPIPFPRLEKLVLNGFHLPPAMLITLLSQWNLQEVYLQHIRLQEDEALASRHSKKNVRWSGFPLLWDAVLRGLSEQGAAATRILGLRHIKEDPRHYTDPYVSFDHDPSTPDVAVSDDREQVVVTRPGSEDVFQRAASALHTPAGGLPPSPEQPTSHPKLAQVPEDVLLLIVAELPRRTICNLRLMCKALADALLPVAAGVVKSVSIVPSAPGIRVLASIASSTFGPYVRHVWLALEFERDDPSVPGSSARAAQLEFLGLEPSPLNSTPTGHDTPFASELGKVLSSLPALRRVGVVAGRGPKPNGLTDKDQRVTDAVFRGLLFATAHAHAAGRTIATVEFEAGGDSEGSFTPRRKDENRLPPQLSDSAFALTSSERERVAPLLGTLETLRLDVSAATDATVPEDSGFCTFMSLCTDVVYLDLEDAVGPVLPPKTAPQAASQYSTVSETQAAIPEHTSVPKWTDQLAEALAPLTKLEVLSMKRYDFPPSVLIQILTQVQLRSIMLREIELKGDAALATDDAPRLWDQVLRAASSHATPKTHRLGLSFIRESYGNQDDPRTYKVEFDCGPDDDEHAHDAVFDAGTCATLYLREFMRPADEERGYDRDVFVRAADLLTEPALIRDEQTFVYDWEI